jgi:putative nucleotidyltransferase with HDIG domain
MKEINTFEFEVVEANPDESATGGENSISDLGEMAMVSLKLLDQSVGAVHSAITALTQENESLNLRIQSLEHKLEQRETDLKAETESKDALLHQHHVLQDELHKAHAELNKAHEDNRNLHLEILDLHSELSADSLPELILQLATRLTGAEVALFTEADGDGTLATIGFGTLREGLNEALYDFSRCAALKEEPIIENDSSALPDGAGLVNLAALQVVSKGKAVGVLLLANKRGSGFNENDTRILLAIGQHAGVALENHRLHSELEQSHAATIAVLADAIEAKDAYTRGHCDSVAKIAVAVAERLGVEKQNLNEVRYAALLHDVGKIGVPDGILLKPGKLLPEEFTMIQRHSTIGRDLVSRVPRFSTLATAIFHHHEHYDGAGYPEGLSGEEIPLSSRIICVVDAFDAMTTTRPYRTPVSRVDALQELQNCAGTHFDPSVVAAIVQVIQEQPEDGPL